MFVEICIFIDGSYAKLKRIALDEMNVRSIVFARIDKTI